MPGLLAMEQQAIAVDPTGSISDRAHVRPPEENDAPLQTSKSQMNGVRPVDDHGQDVMHSNAAIGNETAINGGLKSHRDGRHPTPPALDSSWRTTPANKPFGKLLDRMAQMCYTDLQELVTKLSEEQVREDAPQTNGGGGIVTTDDTSVASVKKKRLLLDFASTWRERFVKALVISDWSRTSGDDVAKIIDLRATLMERVVNSQQAIQAIGDLKRDTVGSRMPAFNLKGAMQYLSAGKSAYPDLDVVKEPPLSARQILDLLEEMGTIANLRLCLDEPTIPQHMAEYTIADGRVTFKCPGEFQVDLACLDQDPEKSPWYFVDFRFDFSPAPSQISDQVRPHLEASINSATARDGLQGCYDFCHAFVLDQKLVEIESQAYQLMRERWSNVLSVQRMRRVVTAHYWTKRKAVKPSWIEFSICSGKTYGVSAASIPLLSLRWFKEGLLSEDVSLKMDWSSINVEEMLFRVIQQHSAATLRQIQASIERRVKQGANITLELQTLADDPYGTKLVAHIGTAHPASNNTVTCSMGPYTGAFALSPRPAEAQDLEAVLNHEADTARIASQLERFICTITQEGVSFETGLEGWSSVTNVATLSAKERKAFFGSGVYTTFWQPTDKWNDSSAISCSTSLEEQAWHIVQLKSIASGHQVVEAIKLEIIDSAWDTLLKRVLLKAVEQVQCRHMQAQARQESISYTTEHFNSKVRLTSRDTVRSTAYFFDSEDLIERQRKPAIKKWSQGRIAVSPGVLFNSAAETSLVRHEIRATIVAGKLVAFQEYYSDKNTDNIAVHPNGGLAVLMQVPLGTSFLSSLRTTVLGITRLDRSISVLNRLSMKIEEMNLQHIAFSYGPQHAYSMRLSYAKHGMLPVKLRTASADTNPHQRIRVSLEKILNMAQQDTFEMFAHTLLLTLPLLLSVESIERAATPGHTFTFHVRHATWYSIKYRGTTNINFIVRARARLEGTRHAVKWHVEQERHRAGAVPDALSTAITDFWTQPDIDGVTGLRSGVATGADGIASVIEKLHSIVSPFVESVENVAPLQSVAAKTEAPSTVKKEASTDKQDVIMLD